MGLETGTYIDSLVVTNPVTNDPVHQGDDHLRLIKSTIKNTFPNLNGAMTATDEQLSALGADQAALALLADSQTDLTALAGIRQTLSSLAVADLMRVNRLFRAPSSVTLTYASGLLTNVLEVVEGGTRSTVLSYSSSILGSVVITVDGVVRTEVLSYSASLLTGISASEV